MDKVQNLKNWITAIEKINETVDLIIKTVKDEFFDASIEFDVRWSSNDRYYFLLRNFDFKLILPNQIKKYSFNIPFALEDEESLWLAWDERKIDLLDDDTLDVYLDYYNKIQQEVKNLKLDVLHKDIDVLHNNKVVLVKPYLNVYNNKIAFIKTDNNNPTSCVLDTQTHHLYYKNANNENTELDLNIFTTNELLILNDYYDTHPSHSFEHELASNPPLGKIIGVGFDIREIKDNVYKIMLQLDWYSKAVIKYINKNTNIQEHIHEVNKNILTNWESSYDGYLKKQINDLNLDDFYLQLNYLKALGQIYKPYWSGTMDEKTRLEPNMRNELIALLKIDYKEYNKTISNLETPTIDYPDSYFVLDLKQTETQTKKPVLTKTGRSKL